MPASQRLAAHRSGKAIATGDRYLDCPVIEISRQRFGANRTLEHSTATRDKN